jgi:hypothetical protein
MGRSLGLMFCYLTQSGGCEHAASQSSTCALIRIVPFCVVILCMHDSYVRTPLTLTKIAKVSSPSTMGLRNE